MTKPHIGMPLRLCSAERLTNAFSKKPENHRCAMSLQFLYYNFVRVDKTLRTSPAMEAGITKRLWEMSDVVEMLEAWEEIQP